MQQRTALVTGANGVIGLAICQQLSQQGFRVVLACRDVGRGRQASKRVPGSELEVVDVSQRQAITELAARWHGPLHVLVNNAGITPKKREETPEGIELQLATNVLGYLWLAQALLPVLKETAEQQGEPSRIVNVASYWAGGLDLDDLEFRRRRYDNDGAYRQSKQANRMLTRAQAEELDPKLVTVNACHPGDVPSTLASNLGFGGHQTAAEAADTPAWLAFGEEGGRITGGWFSDRGQSTCRFMQDSAAVAALFAACKSY